MGPNQLFLLGKWLGHELPPRGSLGDDFVGKSQGFGV